LLLRPAAVAVHDDGNMSRDTLLDYVVFLAHIVYFSRKTACFARSKTKDKSLITFSVSGLLFFFFAELANAFLFDKFKNYAKL
jgi:hypothetical protein